MSKESIIDLFYIEHLKVKEIAMKENTSSAYITKIIKQDDRYMEEKEYRKAISKSKRKISQNNFIKNKREKKKIEDNYSFVIAQHKKASKELSKSTYLTNESYRKWNYSAYKYNPSKKRYEFKENLGRSSDVPKYIKERWKLMGEKILELFKLADELNENQDKVFAEITYTADNAKSLRIVIRDKCDYIYVEKCEIILLNNPIPKLNSIIQLLRYYIGGIGNE